MGASLNIPLNPTIPYKGGTLSSLTVREPTAGEVHDAEAEWAKAGAGITAFRDFQVKLLSLLSGVEDDALRLLPIRQADQAIGFIQEKVDGSGEVPAPFPDTLSIPLDTPVTTGGIQYDVLKLKEPTLGDMRWAEATMNGGSDAAANRRFKMQLVSQVSEIGWAAVQSLPNSKVNEAAAYLMGFMNGGPATGPA